MWHYVKGPKKGHLKKLRNFQDLTSHDYYYQSLFWILLLFEFVEKLLFFNNEEMLFEKLNCYLKFIGIIFEF